jgi:c-di-GMP-binding flagellar brake protein YcgR
MKKERAFKRYKSTNEIQANIEKFQTDVIDIKPMAISLVDISEGGLCVDMKDSLPIDQHVNVDVKIDNKTFNLIARVVWNKKYNDYYKVGLELVYVDELFVFKLKSIVNQQSNQKSNN